MSKPIIKMALMMLDNIRQQLIDGECDEGGYSRCNDESFIQKE